MDKSPIGVLFSKVKNESCVDFNFENGMYTFLNCFSYLYYRKHVDLYKNYHTIYCDGILMQKLVSLAGIKTQRISFDMTSLAPIVFEHAEKNNMSVALIGSDQISNDIAAKRILEKYSKLIVIEKRNGYFNNPAEEGIYLDLLRNIDPDIIIVGMGTPGQDLFLSQMYLREWTGVAFTCGGFLHQTAKNGSKYYPDFFNKYNLRWLYRIIDEPKLLYRYLFDYPKSILLFLYDLMCFKIMAKSHNKDEL
ncbi:WecB/TagA/CpsF family glycosyltransferase [Raoultella sp. BAC10a-01-01]|uniref:WecB/TagA/CpsF family glycosyltransferase n=1 Tax=Raoultella scottii TaxID=3040937 RepID=A0ABU8Z5T5_9ENTR